MTNRLANIAARAKAQPAKVTGDFPYNAIKTAYAEAKAEARLWAQGVY